ncbi:MAG: adenylate/guanylate cyclase domain-containing protein [Treponema sp.]|nr:adenylate/guanylate cyclase domain-containing protein [Treponema sp.]
MALKKPLKKIIPSLLIPLLVFTAAGILHLFHVFDYLEYKSYDFRVRLFADSYKPSDDIIVILLDQDSIDWAGRERGWSWPWPRSAYAELTRYVQTGGAKSLVFDVLFSEPSIYRGDDDGAFAEAADGYGRVVQAVFFSTQTGSVETWPGDPQKPLFNPAGFESIISGYSLGKDRVGAQFPIAELEKTAAALGTVTNAGDSDGVNRRARLFTSFDGRAVPGLSAAALLVSGSGREVRYNEKKRQIEWDGRVIPVDRNGRSILRFKGALNRYIPYSMGDILISAERLARGEKPDLGPEVFADRHVFFGFYAPGLFDICSTPIESVYPGMGVHVTMLDNILSGDFIQEVPCWAEWLILVTAVLTISILVLFSGRLALSVGGFAVVCAGVAASALAAYNAGWWLPMVLPLGGALGAFVSGTVYNYATEGSQKRYIKSAFGQYLSPEVIEQIIADPSNLELGGKSMDMSAIFTDIQRFSSISEGLQNAYGKDGPRELVNLLNLYLTEMSNIVLANRGTIDKFEGDAIIAFFGAPVPTDRHAAMACRAAVQMKKAEAELTGRIMDKTGRFCPVLQDLIEKRVIRPNRPLYTRIGINSGEMVVGNMGTSSKMNYTIMGNAVNLAARLEGVNKQYDTGGILISEYTREKIGDDEFVLRPLSRVRVVGIHTPVRLYELLDLRASAPTRLLEAAASWEDAFRAYENRDFASALAGFDGILRQDSGDLTARFYMNRCRGYCKAPPSGAEWDGGVDNLSSK